MPTVVFGTTSGSWATDALWVGGSKPVAGDTVIFPPGAGSITSGLDQSALTIANLFTLKGYTGTFGDYTAGVASYLQIVVSGRCELDGSGLVYLDLKASSISPQVFGTANASTGNRGLYLKGSALSTVAVMGGSVGIGAVPGATATVTKVEVAGRRAFCEVGRGVSLTTFEQTAGESEIRCAATTINGYGGKITTLEAGAVTAMNLYDGVIYSNSTGTITGFTVNGGVLDFTTSAAARTVTNPTLNAGELRYDPGDVTFTNRLAVPSGGPLRILGSRIPA